MLRSVYWKPDPEPPREAVGGAYEVFLDQRAFVAMHEHVWSAPSDRAFGWLIGDLCEDPTAGRRFIIVTGVIPSRFPYPEAEPGPAEEGVVALKLEVERRRGVLVGWYHSHPDGALSLSAADVSEHERRFPEPWQVAFLFVTDPSAPRGACFRRTPDGFDGDMPMPFHEMVTNESLLARGVRRSRLDWGNVATLDEVRPEPPPRPEAPPRPPEPEPEPEREPAPEPEPEPEPEPAPEPGPEDEPDAEPEPDREAAPAVERPAEGAAGEPEDAPTPSPDALPGPAPETPRAFAEEPDPLTSSRFDADAEELGPERHEPDAEPAGRAAPPADAEDAEDFDAMVAELLGAEPGAAPTAPAPDLPDSAEPAAPPESGVPSTAEEAGAGERGDAEPGRDEKRAEPGIRPPDRPARAAPDAAMPAPPVREEPEVPPPPSVSPETRAAPAATPPAPAAVPPRRSRRGLAIGAVAVVVLALVVVGGLRLVASRSAADRGPGPSQTPAVGGEVSGGERTEDATGDGAPAAGAETPAAGAEDRDRPEVAPERAVEGAGADAAAPAGEGAVPRTAPGAVAPPAPDRVQLEAMSDRVLEAISRFYGRDVARERGEIGCPQLQAAFLEVMDSWIDYSTRGKQAWQGRLPEELAERDERLYLGVQDVERLFAASGCPRP